MIDYRKVAYRNDMTGASPVAYGSYETEQERYDAYISGWDSETYGPAPALTWFESQWEQIQLEDKRLTAREALDAWVGRQMTTYITQNVLVEGEPIEVYVTSDAVNTLTQGLALINEAISAGLADANTLQDVTVVGSETDVEITYAQYKVLCLEVGAYIKSVRAQKATYRDQIANADEAGLLSIVDTLQGN